jgi:hypothetical protein
MIIPTRTARFADGKIEVQRIVLPPPPEQWNPEDPLPFESAILWLLPVESLDYVRVAVIHHARSRRGPLALKGDVVLAGYSKLAESGPVHPRTHCFTRRVFYLTMDDGRRNLNDVPETAVDPSTLLPGHSGSAPDTAPLNGGYPRHARRKRRSVLRNPVELGKILAAHHGLHLAAS